VQYTEIISTKTTFAGAASWLSGLLFSCLVWVGAPAHANEVKGYAMGPAASYQQVDSSALADIAVSYDDAGLVASAWFLFGDQTLRADFGKGGVPFLTGLKFGSLNQNLGFDPGSASLELSGKTFAAARYGAVLQALVDQVINPLDFVLSDFNGCHAAEPCLHGLIGLGGTRQAHEVTAAAILFGSDGALVDNAVFTRSDIDTVRANAGYVAFSADAIPALTPVGVVPEPSTWALMGACLLVVGSVARRRGVGQA
jgi:PEP-CTERM motif